MKMCPHCHLSLGPAQSTLWRRKRWEQGLCAQCGEPNPNGAWRCDRCRAKASAEAAARYRTRAQAAREKAEVA